MNTVVGLVIGVPKHLIYLISVNILCRRWGSLQTNNSDKPNYLNISIVMVYSMKYIRTILRKIMPKELPKTLGRWNIEQCNTKTNHKIDLSNEDHCGPCGQYALTKIELQMNKDRKSDIEKWNKIIK